MTGRGRLLRLMSENGRGTWVHVLSHGLVLGLSASLGGLLGHDPLSLRGEFATIAFARPVGAVPFVSLEGDLEPVVPAAGAIGRRSRRRRGA